LLSGEERKKKKMRAFNSSYVHYVRSLIQSLEKECTSAPGRAPLSVLPGPILVDKQARFFAQGRNSVKVMTT
jgi:hypothetical protein